MASAAAVGFRFRPVDTPAAAAAAALPLPPASPGATLPSRLAGSAFSFFGLAPPPAAAFLSAPPGASSISFSIRRIRVSHLHRV